MEIDIILFGFVQCMVPDKMFCFFFFTYLLKEIKFHGENDAKLRCEGWNRLVRCMSEGEDNREELSRNMTGEASEIYLEKHKEHY